MLVAEPQVLQKLGWNEYFVAQLPMIKETLAQGGSTGAQIARVTGVERTGLSIAPQGELLSNQVPISGRWFRGDESTRPTIGDWVVVDTETGSLVQMLARRSLIQRINPLGALQLIAAHLQRRAWPATATSHAPGFCVGSARLGTRPQSLWECGSTALPNRSY